MLWINLGLGALVVALVVALVSVWRPWAAPAGRVTAALGVQIGGVFVVTWFLVQRGQSLVSVLPPPPQSEAAIWSKVSAPAFDSLVLILLAAAWGTAAGTAAAWLVAFLRSRRLELLIGIGSLVWVIPTFLIAIFAQELQSAIYDWIGVNVSGGYAQFSLGQLAWAGAVLAVRPAAYSYRQSDVLIKDQAHAGFVRTARAKGLGWGAIVRRHVVRPAASGLAQTSASSVRLMFGSLPLVEFFFAYPGLGHLLLQSLGVASGANTPTTDPELAIASACRLAAMLAVIEAGLRIASQRLDPRMTEAEAA